MGACREGANLWFYLGFWKNGGGTGKNKWRFPEFIKTKRWRSEYFWQDTFLIYFNRLVGCRLFGHRKIHTTDEYRMNDTFFCFNCYRKLGPTPPRFEEVKIK